ncbi:hypothetical protein H310_06897 [Aphanomyces invadans]|uniref:RNA helicase n=1 Tax=Aphanomyces invadans TaxID=157072 RepID=A0A024U513_9STRA|nr:hypothetical protein H310_06897 [Aphanomyces invadans]ETW01339.1 hypothetical protein H310_06897 [Aphanomyces invadans]|eukprot:XP_008870337.1 hypothetical protein H310_06897 [Aphanomyces invadans]
MSTAPPRKARGHRQKGAGTVAVSQGEQVRQGVLCKEWQRTPVQLLHEYCRNVKRQPPRYHDVHTDSDHVFRVRCVLPDAKTKDKDLIFCPAQSVDTTLDDAKHCAALLALLYLEPTRPHERKLPDPYRDMWLVLQDEQKQPATKPAKRTNALSVAPAPAPTADEADSAQGKVVVLTSDRAFASKAEYSQSKLSEREERNRRQRARENRERANIPVQVFMSQKARELVESVLDDVDKSLERVGHDNPERLAEIQATLTSMAFKPMHIQAVLDQCPDLTDDTAVLDWLCLHVPENELPKGFNPNGTQLEVVGYGVVSKAAKALEESAGFDSALHSSIFDTLGSSGYSRNDCLKALDVVNANHPGASIDIVEHEMKLELSRQLRRAVSIPLNETIENRPADELDEALDEELMVMESIYDDKCTMTVLSPTKTRMITIQLMDDKIELVFYLPPGSQYPYELPHLFLRRLDLDDVDVLAITGHLLDMASKLCGGPTMYELSSAVQGLVLKPRMTKPIELFREDGIASTGRSAKSTAKSSTKKAKSKPRKVNRKNNSTDATAIHALLYEKFQQKLQNDKYKTMLAARSKLPAFQERDTIVSLLQSNQVVLISGATGCGKTTQVPQFLLDHFIPKQEICNIICTQPRRLAAIGVATRVAQERCESIGESVGYAIRMETRRSQETRLLFCTTGLLLRRLLEDPLLEGVSHVIVDEVHERNVDTDFLLSILRDVLRQRSDLRLLLMSATMNTSLFVEYFGATTPVLSIPGFTYPVTCHYIKHVLDVTETMEKQSDDAINYRLVASLVEYLVGTNDNGGAGEGAILIFMPGVQEIKMTIRELQQSKVASSLLAYPLHGALPGHEQSRVFDSAPKFKTKVIVSTNVAETSITIDDIVVVIDAGKAKEMAYDAINRRSILAEQWVSQAAADQRKGRAGRVRPGVCYRLFSNKQFQKMALQPTPEIHRVSLEPLCLQIQALELGPVETFLANAIEPPSSEAIESAIEGLIEMGAMSKDADEQVQLTPLGAHLARLPMDARMGKVVVFGCILRCIDPIVTIAAALSSKSPFVSSPDDRSKGDALKRQWSEQVPTSDQFLLWNVVKAFSSLSKNVRRAYCKDNCLSYETMMTILELRQQYLEHCQVLGFYDPANAAPFNQHSTNPKVIKAALTAGLYGNVLQVVYPEQKYYESANGVLAAAHDAKAIQFFIRKLDKTKERVFLHPTSLNFTRTQFESPWLVYNELVQTSKIFVRECTMVAPYALLLFGGQLTVQHEKGLLLVDNWIKFHAVARIGVLVKALRHQLDHLLAVKVTNPTLDLSSSHLIDAICDLLITEGM